MERRPVYQKIFEYLDEHYEMISPDTPLTRIYKRDIYENQYNRLDGPVNPKRIEFDGPVEAANVVSEFAWAAGADLVGFTEVKDSFVFEGVNIDHEYAVVLAMEMDFDRIATAPGEPSGIEVLRVYWRLGDVVVKTAEFIRSLGHRAVAHHPRRPYGNPPTILHTVAALEAGLGEIGRHGLLMTEEFGSRIRVATATTDLELPQTSRKNFGATDFCLKCHVCEKACPGCAIPGEKALKEGIERWAIDPYKCLPHFAKYDGCNICVAKCVLNRRKESQR
jgi:hypothetical protein